MIEVLKIHYKMNFNIKMLKFLVKINVNVPWSTSKLNKHADLLDL